METIFSFPSAKKPMDFESADQKGISASSVSESILSVRVEASQDSKTLTVTQTGNVDNVVVYDRK